VVRKVAQCIEDGQSIQQGEVNKPWVVPYNLIVKIEEQTLMRWLIRLPNQPDLDEVPTYGILIQVVWMELGHQLLG